MELVAQDVSLNLKNKIILENINLNLSGGKIYAFVGENGAGKTMLFRVLSGLIKQTSGVITLDEKILHKDIDVLPNMGIMIENAGLYPDLTGFENLRLLSKLNGKIGSAEIRNAIEKSGLNPDDKRPFRK